MEITAPNTQIEDPVNNFRINDLLFRVPPTQISIDHLDIAQQWETLRTRHPIKIPSGRGDLTIMVQFTVIPEELDKLHRLIQEFKYTPFWQIENNYVRSQVTPGLPQVYAMAACAAHMSVTTVPDLPRTFEVTLTMYWFNYFPFTSNFQYKKDWHIDFDGRRRGIYDDLGNGLQVPTPEDIEIAENPADTDPLVGALAKYEGWGLSPEALSEDAVDLGDLSPQLWVDVPTDRVDCHHSNVYMTFLNYLQAQQMELGFGTFGAVQDVLDGKGYNDLNAFPIRYPNFPNQIQEDITFTYNEYMVYEPPEIIGDLFRQAAKKLNDLRAGDETRVISNGKWADGTIGAFAGEDEIHLTSQDYIDHAHIVEKQKGLPPGMLLALLRHESGNHLQHWGGPRASEDPKGLTNSGTGARGIAMFLPKTGEAYAKKLGISGGYEQMLDSPLDCISAAGLMLSELKKEWDGRLNYAQADWLTVLAAYNWGSGNLLGTNNPGVDEYRQGAESLVLEDGTINFKGLRWETQNYITEITGQTPEELAPTDLLPYAEEGYRQQTTQDYLNGGRDWQDVVGATHNLPESIYDAEEDPIVLTNEMRQSFQEEMNALAADGWKYYVSQHVANVFYRKQVIRIGENNTDGQSTIVTTQGFTLSNHFASLPLLSWSLPTYQFMGGQDTKFFFSIVSVNNAQHDQLSIDAQRIAHMKNTLERNGRVYRMIPDSWACECSSAVTRITGAQHLLFNRVRSESVPGNPGLYSMDVECDIGGPLTIEGLESEAIGGRTEFYKDLIKILLKHVTTYHLRTTYAVEFRQSDGSLETRMLPFDRGQWRHGVQRTRETTLPNLHQTIYKITEEEGERAISQDLLPEQITELKAELLNATLADQRDENRTTTKVVGLDAISYQVLPDDRQRVSFLREYDAIFQNEVDIDEDPNLYNAVEAICRVMRIFSIALSHEGFGGLSLTEIREEDIWGLEERLLPVFESHDWSISPDVQIGEAKAYVIGHQVVDVELLLGLQSNWYFNAETVDEFVETERFLTHYKRYRTAFGYFTLLGCALLTAGGSEIYNYNANPVEYDLEESLGHTEQEQESVFRDLKWANKVQERRVLENLIESVLIPILHTIYERKDLRHHKDFIELFSKYYNESAATRAPCYPDLPLPPHPYFNQPHYTNPDFYFFNEGDDGDETLEKGQQAHWKEITKKMCKQAYMSWEDFSKGKIQGPKPQVTDENVDLFSETDAEGAYHKFQIQNEGSNFPIERCKNATKNEGDIPVYRTETIKERFDRLGENQELSTGRGFMDNRNTEAPGEQLQDQGIYGNASLPEQDIDMGFDLENIEKMTLEAAEDIMESKLCMRRAFPAFRVEFISEPDEQALWHIYSKTHAYAAAMNVTITRNKEVPADLAIVELQNISGVLDGSLLGGINDMAYNNIPQDKEEAAEDPRNAVLQEYMKHIYDGTPLDHFFNSIIVRPGIGIRIKLGYTNDHRNMETRFIGKIVEVHPSANQDSLTLICQSYGVELVASLKGVTGEDLKSIVKKYGIHDPALSWSVPYSTTFDVITNALQSPEVLHFGRREWGAEFMNGEAINSADDSKLYEHGWKVGHLYSYIKGDVNRASTDALWGGLFVVESGVLEGTELTWGQAGLATALLITGGPLGPLFGGAALMWPLIKKALNKKKNELAQNPIDDNVYVPHPDDYVDYGIWDPTGGISANQIAYHFYRTTIWDTLKEMTLRHPGWICSPMPYGNRMTLFFGVPSQKYWARPADPGYISEMKELYAELSEYVQSLTVHPTMPRNETHTREMSGVMDRLIAGYNLRRLRFRRYHLLTSKHDIIANNITASESNVFNTVIVRYADSGFAESWKEKNQAKKLDNQIDQTHIVKISQSLEDKDVRSKQISFPNCRGKSLAHRYGVATLCRGLAAMYQGELITLSKTKIKPHDIIFLLDEYSDMAGPAVVKEVTTSISPRHGMIDTIVPEAFVITNEISSKNIVDGLRCVIMEHANRIMPGLLSEALLVTSPSTTTASNLALIGSGVHNLVAAVQGGIEYYYFTKRKNAAIVIPLTRYGEPMVAGVPTDKVDTMWHNFRGSMRMLLEDITQGHMERQYEANLYSWRIFDSWDGEYRRRNGFSVKLWEDPLYVKMKTLDDLGGS